jgi:hypothetical protein
LSDSAVLSGGATPTGTITFTLTGPGGFSFTQTDTVNGNGTYTASDTLPTSGMVAGTYTWSASYSGDTNNSSTSDQGGTAEQTVVSPASPSLLTTASPGSVTVGTSGATLSDSAVLSGGFFETGSITFTLTGPGGFSFTQTDTVNGNGTYTASDALTAGAAAGTYTWSATYNGDDNNLTAQDQGGTAEQTIVTVILHPSLVTTASSALTLGTTAPTLSDSAVLSGGGNPTGTITFTLTGPGGFSFTQTDTVNGNGTYTASDMLPTTGTVAGTYTWSAHYSGNGTNTSADDQGGTGEQTVVSPAHPNLRTSASPGSVTLGTSGATLSDSAVLSGGFFETGSITFTLTGPGGFSFTQTDTVNGNGTYTASDALTAGAATGTYTWSATYSGNDNNLTAVDQGGAAEQTVVTPPQVLSGALTPGFWKNHPNAWPVTSLTIGGMSFSETQLLTLLTTSRTGDAVLILAYQLIAAELNIAAHNVVPSTMTLTVIMDANNLLSSNHINILPGQHNPVSPSSTLGAKMVNFASYLNDFNNRLIT